MVTQEGIQKVKKVIAGGGVDDLIYPRERVSILGAGFVETGEVHAEASTAYSFRHDHQIGNPCGVSHLTYQPSLLQLVDFLNDEVKFL
jgi:hypothetical protein